MAGVYRQECAKSFRRRHWTGNGLSGVRIPARLVCPQGRNGAGNSRCRPGESNLGAVRHGVLKEGGVVPKKRILAAAIGLAFSASGFESRAQSIAPTTLPTGGRVVAGQATIGQSGAAMQIVQGSTKAALDWASFSIGSQAAGPFSQPSASAIALNRVLGNNASEIYGRLSANGQVFLLNPNGILFARGSQVDVGGIVASTLTMSSDDFMAGRYRLTGSGTAGSVV